MHSVFTSPPTPYQQISAEAWARQLLINVQQSTEVLITSSLELGSASHGLIWRLHSAVDRGIVNTGTVTGWTTACWTNSFFVILYSWWIEQVLERRRWTFVDILNTWRLGRYTQKNLNCKFLIYLAVKPRAPWTRLNWSVDCFGVPLYYRFYGNNNIWSEILLVHVALKCSPLNGNKISPFIILCNWRMMFWWGFRLIVMFHKNNIAMLLIGFVFCIWTPWCILCDDIIYGSCMRLLFFIAKIIILSTFKYYGIK